MGFAIFKNNVELLELIEVCLIQSLQKEVEALRLASLAQQSEAQRLTSSLASVQYETRELQEELERRNNNIKAKVFHCSLTILWIKI